jgi:SseB protein N-terminal domain
MDSEVFLVLVPESGKIEPGPDGNATIPEGTKLNVASAERDGQRFFPLFTAPSRARAWFKGDHIVAPDKTRDLFGRCPDVPFMLNPGSDFGKEFTPREIARLLAGQFDEGPQTITLDKPTQVLLGHPKELRRRL